MENLDVLQEKTVVKKAKNKRTAVAYPQNLINDIFDNTVSVDDLPECEKTLEYLLSNLSEKWAECMELRYQNKYTLEKIGEIVRVTKVRVAAIIEKALSELKKPENIKCIELGLDGYENYLKDQQRQQKIEKANRNLYEIPVEELELSGRAYNALMRNGITTIGKLSEVDKEKLVSLKNMGVGTADEVIESLNDYIDKRNSI